jgi:hypothetical protein
MKQIPRTLRPAAVALAMIGCIAPFATARAAHIQVTTTQQGFSPGLCSLEEAIYSSELRSNTAIDTTPPDHFYTTGCVPGTGNDTIELPAGAVFNFDGRWPDSHNPYGPTATPIIFSLIDIEGNGATLQSTGNGFSPFVPLTRLFAVGPVSDLGGFAGAGSLTLRNVNIRGFHVKGGDGGYEGGGGGLGAGGAIYVDHDAVLLVENSTFENNGVVGGNGGSVSEFERGGGGGGGLSGNGGDSCTGGGGGGGSGENGGKGACSGDPGGGGGGGTLFSPFGVGGDGSNNGFGVAGRFCGGRGGDPNFGEDGGNSTCPGGGGGGGAARDGSLTHHGNGGAATFGGGGGGGSTGGDGGFGGGGGAGGLAVPFSSHGGNGGFGGGGGYTTGGAFSDNPGKGGDFGGRASGGGGGGGALGGVIFSYWGTVIVRNSTFFSNYVLRGVGGDEQTDKGADAGGAVFSFGGELDISNSTISGNEATSFGGGVVFYVTYPPEGEVNLGSSFHLYNTIIANNGANECYSKGPVTSQGGAGNLIMQNGVGAAPDGPFDPCPSVVSTRDPRLWPLQLNSPGNTPTMAIDAASPALNSADPSTSIFFDQRGAPRPALGGFDIGAFEVQTDIGVP